MRRSLSSLEEEGAEAEANRVTASLAGLALALALVLCGLYLVGTLRDKGRVEDCLMAGRLNCDQLLAVHAP